MVSEVGEADEVDDARTTGNWRSVHGRLAGTELVREFAKHVGQIVKRADGASRVTDEKRKSF